RSSRQAQSLERWPGRLHKLAERSFCVRRDVRRDYLQSLGEKQRGPTRTDHAGADDGDAANGFGVGHVTSPMRSSDFGISDAREIALGVEEVALVLAIEIGRIDRAGEVGDEHSVAGHVEGDADALHQMLDEDLRCRLCVDRRTIYGIAARRIATIGPIEDAVRQIELEVDRFRQMIEQHLDVGAVDRVLALRDVNVCAEDATQPGVVRAFLRPVDLSKLRVERDPDAPPRLIAPVLVATAGLDQGFDLRAVEVRAHYAHALAVAPIELAV